MQLSTILVKHLNLKKKKRAVTIEGDSGVALAVPNMMIFTKSSEFNACRNSATMFCALARTVPDP
jgi:hypothetical protein